MTTHHTLHFSAADALSERENESVHLAVTSPPYPMIEMWDAAFADWESRYGESGETALESIRSALDAGRGWNAFEAMHVLLDSVWRECFRVLTDGGFLVINIGDATRSLGSEFALYPNHARIVSSCVSIGFTSLPGILWRKQTNAPNKFMGSGMLPAGAYVTLEHEHILILRKGGKRVFRANAEKARRRESALFWEERNRWFSDLWDFKGDRQEMGDGAERSRSGAFPFELPFRIVNMYSLLDDLVLDPFAGTGTTLAAAAACGRHSVGYEVDVSLRPAVAATCSRITDAGRARQEQRLSEHRDFVAKAAERGRPKTAHHNRTHDLPVVTGQERELTIMRPERVQFAAGSLPTQDPAGASGPSQGPAGAAQGPAGAAPSGPELDLFPATDSHGPLSFDVDLEPAGSPPRH